MRIENNRLVSLEEDIENIWSLHGWEVVKEEVGKERGLDYWKIYTKRKEEKEVDENE